MKVLIIDDDISFITELEMNLEEIGLTQTRSETTEEGAIKAIVEYKPDLVICDINLHGENSGIALSRLMSSRHLAFIIVTQYKDDELFEDIILHQPIAYFTKPIDFFALKYTINNLMKERVITPSGGDLLSDSMGNYIFIRKKSKYEKVNYSDVHFIEAEGNYITFNCTDHKYVVRSSLRRCLERISSNYFIQIHRNYIANIHRIKGLDIDKSTVQIDSVTLPVGRSYKSALRKRLPYI